MLRWTVTYLREKGKGLPLAGTLKGASFQFLNTPKVYGCICPVAWKAERSIAGAKALWSPGYVCMSVGLWESLEGEAGVTKRLSSVPMCCSWAQLPLLAVKPAGACQGGSQLVMLYRRKAEYFLQGHKAARRQGQLVPGLCVSAHPSLRAGGRDWSWDIRWKSLTCHYRRLMPQTGESEP